MTQSIYYPTSTSGFATPGTGATSFSNVQAEDGNIYTNGTDQPGDATLFFNFASLTCDGGTPIIDSVRFQGRMGIMQWTTGGYFARLRYNNAGDIVGPYYPGYPTAVPPDFFNFDVEVPGPITVAQIQTYFKAEIGNAIQLGVDYVRVVVNWHCPAGVPDPVVPDPGVSHVTVTKSITTVGPLTAGGYVDWVLDVTNAPGSATATGVVISDPDSTVGVDATRTWTRTLPLGGAVSGASSAVTSGSGGIAQTLNIPAGVMVRYQGRDVLDPNIPNAAEYANTAVITAPAGNVGGTSLEAETETRLIYQASVAEYGPYMTLVVGDQFTDEIEYTVPASNEVERCDIRRVQVMLSGATYLVVVGGNKWNVAHEPQVKVNDVLVENTTPPTRFYVGGTSPGEHVQGGTWTWIDYVDVSPGDSLKVRVGTTAYGNFVEHESNHIATDYKVRFIPLEF